MADGAWSLDATERRVLAYLEQQARGRVNVIPMPELAAALSMGTREVQQVIHRLVALHGLAICSSSKRGWHGYWLPATEDEVRDGKADLTGRIRRLALRLRALDAAAAREFTRQLALEMADGEERSDVRTFEGSE